MHGGWSLYVKDGLPKFAYNFVGAVTTIAADEPLPAGPVTLTYDFAYDGGKPGSGWHRHSFRSTVSRPPPVESSAPFRSSSERKTADVATDRHAGHPGLCQG